MADQYNPDMFDWQEDQEGVNLDEVGVDIVEAAIRAALNAHEERYGWRYLKRSDRKEQACRLYRAQHYMPEEGKKFIEENFPGYTFVWDGALGHHDHPVAHLVRELCEIEMLSGLVDRGQEYIDLFGDGKRDSRYKRKCIVLYTKETPKDYLRYQEVLSNMFLYDLDKLCDPGHTFGKIKDIALTHGLYYLDMEKIGRILSLPGRRIHALVHRHTGTHGFLNGGEQEYWVDQDLMVTQVNVATGEKYRHPSLEAMFHQASAKTAAGGVAWTVRSGGGDNFIIEMVGCPNEICEDYVPLRFLKPESWEEHTYHSVSVKKFLHFTWMSATTTQGKIVIEDLDLFDKLRRYVAGKARTPRLKTETMNHARRLCNKLDIISIHGGGVSDVPAANMADYVEVAFAIDQRRELDAALSFHKDNARITDALNLYYEKGTTPKDFTLVTGAAVMTAKTFSEHACRVINSVRDAHNMTAAQYIELQLPDDGLARRLVDMGDGGTDIGPWW